MMIIADSGSTKTDWVVLEDNKIIDEFVSPGINPMTQNEEHINDLLQNIDNIGKIYQHVDFVHYYGAGCASDSKKILIKNVLKNRFNNAEINIQHDLLGAAISVCGREEGIVCILGTGSNCCYFDGKNIHDRRFGNGYIYGDEGSGFDMGKRLIKYYLSHELPNDLKLEFEKQFNLDRESLLNNTYSHKNPNSYVAQFTTFLSGNLNHNLIKSVVSNSFESFFNNNVLKMNVTKSTKINSVGSIGWVFQDIFKEVGSKHGFTFGNIYQKPIEGLVKYHSAE